MSINSNHSLLSRQLQQALNKKSQQVELEKLLPLIEQHYQTLETENRRLNTIREELAKENLVLSASLERESAQAQITLQSIADGVMITDASGQVEFANRAAEALTGYRRGTALNKPVADVVSFIEEKSRQRAQHPVAQALQTGQLSKLVGAHLLLGHAGKELPVSAVAVPMLNDDRSVCGVVLTIQDMTQSRRMQNLIAYQAYHDDLTGVKNRRSLEQALQDALEDKSHLYVLMHIDIARFKSVNDVCGHEAGDELLKQIALLLRGAVDKNAQLVRLSADEFGVLLKGYDLERATELADKIITEIRDYRFVWEQNAFALGASVGLVEISTRADSVQQFMSEASSACLSAKNLGRNRYQVYRESDNELAQRRADTDWAGRIQNAFKQDRFKLYAQPIVPLDMVNPRGKHFEILIRMNDQDDQPISPAQFLPAAERFGLMGQIDRWVSEQTFQWLAEHPAYHEQLDSIGINLSGQTLGDDNFIRYVDYLLGAYPIEAEKVCFEITETVAVTNMVSARSFINQLKQRGFKIALDDFGSGMSSFAYLKNFPVDYLKIDGVFVKDIEDNAIDEAMVEAIHTVGSVMGYETIAEYVGGDAAVVKLQRIGVNYAQGFGIAKPIPLTEVMRHI